MKKFSFYLTADIYSDHVVTQLSAEHQKGPKDQAHLSVENVEQLFHVGFLDGVLVGELIQEQVGNKHKNQSDYIYAERHYDAVLFEEKGNGEDSNAYLRGQDIHANEELGDFWLGVDLFGLSRRQSKEQSAAS